MWRETKVEAADRDFGKPQRRLVRNSHDDLDLEEMSVYKGWELYCTVVSVARGLTTKKLLNVGIVTSHILKFCQH